MYVVCCLFVILGLIQPSHLLVFDYGPEIPLRMNMSSSREITVKVTLDKLDKLDRVLNESTYIRLRFKTVTISPQFNILSLVNPQSEDFTISRPLKTSRINYSVPVKLHANYIGHAILQPISVEYMVPNGPDHVVVALPDTINKLPVTVVQFEGIWGIIFFVSVILLMLLSYINLGAQLDQDNMLEVVRKPKTLILGFLIGLLVMPMIAWFVGQWFFEKQPLYRIGSFVFACSPAASGSTLWTVMFNSDKELSVSLQIISNAAALITMPLLLYIMDKTQELNHELYQVTKVPYSRLIQTLAVLLLALVVGWQFVGKNPRAQKLSQRIYRPLVFFVLIYIIVFSSIVYWHIYQMFDWTITLASFIISLSTYIVSGMLGHCINCDMDRAIAISISSVYKNSGIALAVLLVVFESPDTYIAYVPCLTQIVMISMSFYLAYTVMTLYNYIRRRGQPDVIQATPSNNETADTQTNPGRDVKSDSVGEKSAKSEENDEFIAMNVTDIV